jgi:hypothetical protein
MFPNVLQSQVIDLSSEPAFAARASGLTENRIPLSIKAVSEDRLLVASDLNARCDDDSGSNIYTIAAIDLHAGAIVRKRTIAAPPGSFVLILDANRRPLLVSKASIQVLDPASLETKETISLKTPKSEDTPEPSILKENGPCSDIPFRYSATPDSKLIEVAVFDRGTDTTNLYQINGQSLRVTQASIEGSLPDFRTGFDAMYVPKFPQWYGNSGKESLPICEKCDYLDVLSTSYIETTHNNTVSVQRGTETIWSSKFAGMRDSFDSDWKGNKFAILAATRSGAFGTGVSETVFLFDVLHRNVRRFRGLSLVKRSGPVQGGGRATITFLPNGSQVVVFVGGRLVLISVL